MKNLKNVDRRSSQDSSLNEVQKDKILETVKESKSSNSEAATVESSSKSTTLLEVESTQTVRSPSVTNMKKSSSTGNIQDQNITDEVADAHIMQQLQDRIGDEGATQLVEEIMDGLSSDEEIQDIHSRVKRRGSEGNIPRTAAPGANVVMDGLSRQITDSPLVRLTPVPGSRLASENKEQQELNQQRSSSANEFHDLQPNKILSNTNNNKPVPAFRIGGSISEAPKDDNSDSDDDIY